MMIAGQQVTATLRLVRLLGQGGMGSVWIADHLSLGTQVAVKFMSPQFAQNAGLVQRFRREAMAAAQIKSHHVAQVFDHGVMPDGTPYIVMELLEGEDLRQRIRRSGPMNLQELAGIVTQTAKALGRAHQLGIVHRDIKPDNIFLADVGGEMIVKVLDFGIAKQMVDDGLGATSTGSMLGTPLYMSPEQLLSSKQVDARSDLWSLGVVAYKAMTGAVPFRGETLGALSVAVHAGTFPPPSTVRPDLSASVDRWMLRALQRQPDARFGSAREMAEELERIVREPAVQVLMQAPMREGMRSDPGSVEAASQSRSFPGTSATRAGPQVVPVAFAVVAVIGMIGVLGGGALFFKFRGPGDVGAGAPTTTENAPVATQSAASASVHAVVVAPSASGALVEPVATSTSHADIPVLSAIPSALPAATATAIAVAPSKVPTSPSASARKAPSGPPPGGKDTIGF
jgi:serine/threonine-protein kinase